MALPPFAIEITEADASLQDEVELVSTSPDLDAIVISALQSDDNVRFVPRLASTATPSRVETLPTLLVAIGDARDASSMRRLGATPRAGVLAIAVLIVDAAKGDVPDLPPRGFEALVIVPVASAQSPAGPLRDALKMLTAFVTADCVAVPVDEAYPFFENAGRLAWGSARGENLADCMTRALRQAGRGRDLRGARAMVHVVTESRTLQDDIEAILAVMDRTIAAEEVLWSVSNAESSRRAVSVIATKGRS